MFRDHLDFGEADVEWHDDVFDYLQVEYSIVYDYLTVSVVKQLVDSLEQNICCNKTSCHPTNSGTSLGLRELRQGCSLSMLHRTYEKMHGGVRLGGLSMPNG